MALQEIHIHGIPEFQAELADVVDNKVAGLQEVGAKVYITDDNYKCYKVNSDFTLSPFSSQISIVEPSTGNSATIGSDGSFKTKIVSQDNVVNVNDDGSLDALITDVSSGKATSGSKTTIVDISKNFITNMLIGTIAEVDIADIKYFRKVISNTSNTITINTLPGTAASSSIGAGDNGVVTITSATEGIGGNSYTVQAIQAATPNVNLSAALNGLALEITLGTDGAGAPDATKNTATLVAGVIDALDQFIAVASGNGSTIISAGEVIPFTGGIAIVNVSEGTPYKIKSVKTEVRINNISSDPVQTSFATALNKDLDTIDVAKMSKGSIGIPTELQAITVTTTSNEINASGYNSVLVELEPTGGTWTVEVKGAFVSNGVYANLYNGINQSSTGVISTAVMVLFRGIPDYIKLVATKGSGASANVKYQLLNT